MMNLKLHPSVHATILEPERKLKVNADNLLKVTLGFIPAYVNYHKRVYDQHELDCKQLEPAVKVSSSACPVSADIQQKELDGIELARAAVQSNDESQEKSEAEISTPSLPEVEWSDISESSTDAGWTDSETDPDSSGIESDTDDFYTSASSDGEWSSDYSNWRSDGSSSLGWMEQVSRAIFGSS